MCMWPEERGNNNIPYKNAYATQAGDLCPMYLACIIRYIIDLMVFGDENDLLYSIRADDGR